MNLEDSSTNTAKCQSSKEHMNSARHAVNWDYKVEDMVLLYNSRYKNNNTAVQKLEFWWLEPYKVIKANSRKENYVLAELDGVKRLIQCQNSDWNHMFFVISLSIMSIIDVLMHILKVTAQTSI
jgi:hypothetical protein